MIIVKTSLFSLIKLNFIKFYYSIFRNKVKLTTYKVHEMSRRKMKILDLAPLDWRILFEIDEKTLQVGIC